MLPPVAVGRRIGPYCLSWRPCRVERNAGYVARHKSRFRRRQRRIRRPVQLGAAARRHRRRCRTDRDATVRSHSRVVIATIATRHGEGRRPRVSGRCPAGVGDHRRQAARCARTAARIGRPVIHATIGIGCGHWCGLGDHEGPRHIRDGVVGHAAAGRRRCRRIAADGLTRRTATSPATKPVSVVALKAGSVAP